MKKFSFGLFALVCALCVSSVQAGTVRLTGVGALPAGATSGTMNVVFDMEAQDNFINGGINFSIVAGTPGVIEFGTPITVNGTWSLQNSAVVGGNRVNIALESVSPGGTGGLPTGAQNFVLASVPFTVVGTADFSELTYIVDPDSSLVDGRDFGTNVTPNYTFQANFVSNVPEPATLAMAGMSLIGLAFRRRNG